MSSDALSEELSIRKGVGYDETFGLGDESRDFSPSSKREMSVQSPDGDDESYAKGSEEVEGVNKVREEGNGSDGDNDGNKEDGDGDEEDDDNDEESCEGTSVDPGDNHPFILPEELAVNRFLTLMSDKVFKELCTRYQILELIPIRLLGRTKDVT